MTPTELDAFLAFAQAQRRARAGDTCAALLAILRVVHQELQQHRLNETMASGHALADAPVRF